jgi:hypothetical protein
MNLRNATLEPREATLAQFGESIRDVLDGKRRPALEERISGLFRGVHLLTFVHLMDREPDGKIGSTSVLEKEGQADQLALELLAPQAVVLAQLEERQILWNSRSAFPLAQNILDKNFGLPVTVAGEYARILVLRHRSRQSFGEWLGEKNVEVSTVGGNKKGKGTKIRLRKLDGQE